MTSRGPTSTENRVQRGVAATKNVSPRRRAEVGYIDCDVHERLKSLADLLPHMKEPWRSILASSEYYGDRSPVPPDKIMYVSPAGGDRMDARPPDGSFAGSSFEYMKTQLLDEHNPQFVVLTGNIYMGVPSPQPEFQIALASAYNDWMIDNWLSRDARIKGSLQLAAQSPEAAAAEIERLASHPQIVQVMLPITDTEWSVPKFHPIFAAAERHGLVVAMHVSGSSRCAIPLPRHYISWHAGLSQNYMQQLIGLIFNGVFDKFPTTKVILLEGGWTWLPHYVWRLDKFWRSMRHEVPWVKRPPSEYIREHIKMGTQPLDEPDNPKHLLDIIDMVGTDRFLVYATDYPHFDFDNPQRALPTIFSEDLRERILFKNALDLYAERLP